jgi:hypothetical protein
VQADSDLEIVTCLIRMLESQPQPIIDSGLVRCGNWPGISQCRMVIIRGR